MISNLSKIRFRITEASGTIDTVYRMRLTLTGIKYEKSEVEYYKNEGGKIKKGDFSYEEISKKDFDEAYKKYKNRK